MKRKISILGLVFALVFVFTGCSRSTTEYDQAELEQYADFIIGNFSVMSEEDFDSFSEMPELQLDLMLLEAGVPVSGENFLTMMDAWKAGTEECGAFVGTVSDYTAEAGNDSVTLSVDAQYADRHASIEFTFDEELNMESLTVSAVYSTGEILQKAGLNTLLGMGTVFIVLIFLSFVIWLLKFIPVLEKKLRKSAKETDIPENTAVPDTAPVVHEEGNLTDDGELVAVISAAIAASEGTSSDGFVVRSIRRRKSNKW